MKKCKCGSINFCGIEYHYTNKEHYDGVSEWRCNDCGTRYGRWSEKELSFGEVEKKYGGQYAKSNS